jgi:hypothetical protein
MNFSSFPSNVSLQRQYGGSTTSEIAFKNIFKKLEGIAKV